MRHPSQATLALHAGGDLGPIARWRAERHLADCEECRGEVARFQALREILPDLGEIPDVPWNRLAAEMRANIRLGLAAGECVRPEEARLRKSIFSPRAIVAVVSVIALLATGLMLERPGPRQVFARSEGIVVQSTVNGIQVRSGGEALQLMHAGAENVFYTVGAQGSMRARYVDPQTGYVTINNVYGE